MPAAKNNIDKLQNPFAIRREEPGNSYRAIFAALSLAGLVLWIGCSGTNYGSFKNSRRIGQLDMVTRLISIVAHTLVLLLFLENQKFVR